MLQSIIKGTNDSVPSILSPSIHSGIWFYLIVFLVIFLGAVFIITLVPENSILFLAGTFAVTGQVSLGWVLAASIAGAYVGYDLNYWTGRILSLAFCRRIWPRILRAKNIERTRALMERFGPFSVVISRFIPAVNLPPSSRGSIPWTTGGTRRSTSSGRSSGAASRSSSDTSSGAWTSSRTT